MPNVTRYTPEEAILIGRAGVIASVLGIISAVSPAIDIAEKGADYSNIISFSISFFGFLPFAVVLAVKLEKYFGDDKLNTPLVRLSIITVCAFGAAASLFAILWLTGTSQLGLAIILIAIVVAWWQWPRMPKEPVAPEE